MVFYSQNKKFLGLSHRNKDQMLWLKHYAKANSLVVFLKGRLTVLQINGSRPSSQLAVFPHTHTQKKKLGEQTWILQYVSMSRKTALHHGCKHGLCLAGVCRASKAQLRSPSAHVVTATAHAAVTPMESPPVLQLKELKLWALKKALSIKHHT